METHIIKNKMAISEKIKMAATNVLFEYEAKLLFLSKAFKEPAVDIV